MSDITLALRPATDADAWLYFTLRNDPAAVRASRRPVITPEEHDRWWRTTSDLRLVAEVAGRPVGTLRLSSEGTVSIIVGETDRGRGYGPLMLEALLPYAKAAGHERIFAEVAPENVRSQRAFLTAGWRPVLLERHV